MSRLSLTARFWLLGLIAIFFVAGMGVFGLSQMIALQKTLNRVIATSTALSNFRLGDMMHDALNSDVLNSFLVADKTLEGSKDTVMADVSEHAVTFEQTIKENEALPLDADVKAGIEKVKPALSGYIAAAKEITEKSFQDRSAALAQMPKFTEAFEHLEEENGAVAERIEELNLQDKENAIAQAKEDIRRLILFLVVGSVVLIIMIVAVVRSILAPLQETAEALDRLGRGDTNVRVEGTERKDQLGSLARAVENYRKNLIEADEIKAYQVAQQEKSEKARLDALTGMANTVETHARSAVNTVAERTADMERAAGEMAQSANIVSENANEVSTSADVALNSAEAVAAATEELTASIGEISRQVRHATAKTRETVTISNNAAGTIEALNKSVSQIAHVAHLIQEIASQTNLLALNATIEAARAGDAGKGFAVVAGEVKNLAGQTAKATEEITSKISEINEVTAVAVQAMGEINRKISEVDSVSASIAAAMDQQAAATSEIARSVGATAQAARDVSTRILEVSREAGENGNRADNVRNLSRSVDESIDELRSVLVRTVRTATADVDRRTDSRLTLYPKVMATIYADFEHRIDVLDLSTGGLATGLISSLTKGQKVTVSVDGVAGDYTAEVVALDVDQVRYRFTDRMEKMSPIVSFLANQWKNSMIQAA